MTVRAQIGRLISFFFRSLLWSLNLVLALYTFLGYWLIYKLPVEHWLAGMIMITLPIAWLLNVVMTGLWLVSRPWRSWLSGAVLLVGIALLGTRTFTWHNPVKPPGAGTSLEIFSYNVQSFRLNDYWERYSSSPRARRTINYVLRYKAPVKCLQEVFNSTTIADYDVVRRFRQAGYRYSVLLHPEVASMVNGTVGAAIFSTYPIIHSGRELFNGANGIVWANIKVGDDTVRVINVHLHSMGIRVGRVLSQDQLTGVKHETHGVLSALRFGFIERQEQVQRVQRHIRESEFPVIVTGDFNDTPYSVVYEQMRRTLPSTFENVGRGFGFTYNRPPGFIRIDHQFHDPGLTALNFQTIQSINYSDHYPIAGTYWIK